VIQQNVLDGIKIKNKIYKIQGFSCAFGNKPAPATNRKKGFERNLKAFFVCLIIMEKRLGCKIVELFLTCTISHLCLCCFSRE